MPKGVYNRKKTSTTKPRGRVVEDIPSISRSTLTSYIGGEAKTTDSSVVTTLLNKAVLTKKAVDALMFAQAAEHAASALAVS